ncbi:MAG: polysaccharide biosynthesis protein [Ruminococcaceae bacterium]|nr:polysaccharide biosynthesis protein [Oscillospiraceae bacterium]
MGNIKNSVFLRKLALLFIDASITVVALIFSLFLSRGLDLSVFNSSLLVFIVLCYIVVPTVIYICGTHRIIWRHAGVRDVVNFASSYIFSVATVLIVNMALLRNFVLYSPIELVASLVFSVSCAIAFKMFLRHIVLRRNKSYKKQVLVREGEIFNYSNTMIIGAGAATELLLKEIFTAVEFSKCRPKCLIDDDPGLVGSDIRGIPIVGSRENILDSVKKYGIKTIFFAIPSAKREDRRELLKICSETGCDVRIMPGIDEALDNKDFISKIRKVNISDLLGREPIKIDVNKILGYVENKTVIVTGGGGSIGSELCRQVASHSPKKLIIFDIYENNAYDILNEIKRNYPDLDVLALIGSVRDSERLDSIFDTYRPDIVYHAAAHKHVPLMEDSPHEAIKNNIFGTLNTVRAADKYNVKRFIMISTDKAVNPTNVMGATKRACEMIVQTFNKKSKTEFVAVRFGNVLGSNGSVIPLFEKQIESGGPLTVTHPNIIRYFMTISEAVSLVLSAGASAKGGEIFVLDMGEPVKILDLAENMIKLSGLEPYHDIDIEFTGLRPGEKLYEELLMNEEGLEKTDNSLIFIGQPIDIDEKELNEKLQELWEVSCDEYKDVKPVLKSLVTTFHEPDEINSKVEA